MFILASLSVLLLNSPTSSGQLPLTEASGSLLPIFMNVLNYAGGLGKFVKPSQRVAFDKS